MYRRNLQRLGKGWHPSILPIRAFTKSCPAASSSASTLKKTPKTSFCKKLAFIGGGQMAEAILNAQKISGIQRMADITVFDVSEDRLEHLTKKYGVCVSKNAQEAVDGADLVVLAVKPQNVPTVAKMCKLHPDSLLVSILAGVTIETLQDAFHTRCVVRTMPNTPSMILEGMTVWFATPETTTEHREKTELLLSKFGEQVHVHEEHYLDMATAISGSGPAYVFLTMEAMVDSAVHMGFPRETAKKLVSATIRGSANYANKSKDALPILKNNVTSPGGTTASALYELERGGYRTVVADAVWAAYRRALELGGQNSNVGPGRSRA